jgi:hypothetical protein
MEAKFYRTKNLKENYVNYNYLSSYGDKSIEELLTDILERNKFKKEDLIEITDPKDLEECLEDSSKYASEKNYVEVRYK